MERIGYHERGYKLATGDEGYTLDVSSLNAWSRTYKLYNCRFPQRNVEARRVTTAEMNAGNYGTQCEVQ